MHIKEIFKRGSLYKYKSRNCYRYTIEEKYVLVEIFNLINGKFRTPKIEYLYKGIDYLNKVHNTNINKLPLDTRNLNSNSWLAGLTDVDGCFYISLSGAYVLDKSINRGRVKCNFELKQRKIDKALNLSCLLFMVEIANLF